MKAKALEVLEGVLPKPVLVFPNKDEPVEAVLPARLGLESDVLPPNREGPEVPLNRPPVEGAEPPKGVDEGADPKAPVPKPLVVAVFPNKEEPPVFPPNGEDVVVLVFPKRPVPVLEPKVLVVAPKGELDVVLGAPKREVPPVLVFPKRDPPVVELLEPKVEVFAVAPNKGPGDVGADERLKLVVPDPKTLEEG